MIKRGQVLKKKQMVTGPLKSPAERVSRIPAIDPGSLYSLPIFLVQCRSKTVFLLSTFTASCISPAHHWITPTIHIQASYPLTARLLQSQEGHCMESWTLWFLAGKKPISWYFGTKGLIKAGEYNYTFTLPNQVYGECTEQCLLDPKMIHLRFTHWGVRINRTTLEDNKGRRMDS